MQNSIFVKVRDSKIHIVKKGNGFPIFILHGGPGMDHISMGYKFDPLMDEFTVLYVDLRGHGKSEKVEDSTLTVSEMARDVTELANELGYTKYAVIGHSFGAFVALKHAVDFPKENALTILMNGAISTEGLGEYQQKCMANLPDGIVEKMEKEAGEAQAKFQSTEMSFKDLDIFIRELILAKFPLYFPVANNSIKEFMPFYQKGDINGYILNLMGTNNYGGYNLTNELDKIINKVLVITADKDYICDPKISEDISRQIKDSELHIIKDAGHYPFFDQQEKTIEIIRNFLNANKE